MEAASRCYGTNSAQSQDPRRWSPRGVHRDDRWRKAIRYNAVNRPCSKMAAENLNKSKLKTNTSTRKSTLTLVTLPYFSISGEISAEKMLVENC